MRHPFAWVTLASCLAFDAAQAASGTFRSGSTSTDLAQSVEAGWNVGQWFCRTGSPTLTVWQNDGRCVGRQAVVEFTITSGSGTTVVDHTFEYFVRCSGESGSAMAASSGSVVPEGGGGGDRGAGVMVEHAIRFDGGQLTAIDSGAFDFDLIGGDSLRLVTTEGPRQVSAPALGRAALVIASIVVALGLARPSSKSLTRGPL